MLQRDARGGATSAERGLLAATSSLALQCTAAAITPPTRAMNVTIVAIGRTGRRIAGASIKAGVDNAVRSVGSSMGTTFRLTGLTSVIGSAGRDLSRRSVDSSLKSYTLGTDLAATMTFAILEGTTKFTVYQYCNLHWTWKAAEQSASA